MPGYEEIAAKVGLPVQRVIQYLRLAKVGSGNGPPGDRSGYTVGGNMKVGVGIRSLPARST